MTIANIGSFGVLDPGTFKQQRLKWPLQHFQKHPKTAKPFTKKTKRHHSFQLQCFNYDFFCVFHFLVRLIRFPFTKSNCYAVSSGEITWTAWAAVTKPSGAVKPGTMEVQGAKGPPVFLEQNQGQLRNLRSGFGGTTYCVCMNKHI